MKEQTRLPFWKWLAIAIFDFFKAIILYILDFIWTIIKAFLNIFVGLYKGTIYIGKAIYKGAKSYWSTFIKGNWKTRLSYIMMGSGNLFNGQIAKGITFLVAQIGFILMMIFFGANYLGLITTLGTDLPEPAHWDPDLGVYVPAVRGHNSMLILLFSVTVIMLIIAFLMVYNKNIKSAYENQTILTEGKQPPTFKQEIHELMDKKFHITVLSFPTLTAFAFTIVPLIFMILIAFTNFDRSNQPPGSLFTWVGLDNFINMFSGQNTYYQLLPQTLFKILQWSLIWAVFATFLNYIFGMVLALMINKKGIKLKKMWRTIFVITIAVPQFISLLVVARILDDAGPVVDLLKRLGWVANNFSFFRTGSMARATVIVVNLWVGVPYTMLITSGILMNIPEDLYESATIDGAGPLTKFFKITLPYMLFVTGPYLVTAFIGNINNFNVIYFLTGGGPNSLNLFQAGETDLLVTWLFKLTVDQADYKIASTLGILIFMISSFVSLIMFSKTGAMQKEDQFQ